jgi:hypothetical protein
LLQRVPFSISAGLIPIELDKDEHHDSSENLNLALVPFKQCWPTQLLMLLALFISSPDRESNLNPLGT